VVYDLEEGVGEVYVNFFIETDEGTVIMRSVVPDEARFTQFLHQIRAARGSGRVECSIEVAITGDISGTDLPLLEAGYTAPVGKTTRAAEQLNVQVLFGSPPVPRPIDDLQITYHLDPANPAKAKSRIVYPRR
jgi:hypothetical protein